MSSVGYGAAVSYKSSEAWEIIAAKPTAYFLIFKSYFVSAFATEGFEWLKGQASSYAELNGGAG